MQAWVPASRYKEAQKLHARALEALTAASQANLSLRSDHGTSLAELQRRQGNFEAAMQLLLQAQADFTDDEELTCDALMQAAKVAYDTGDQEAALQSMLSVQARFHKCSPDSKFRACHICECLGWVYFHRQDWQAALLWLERGLAVFEESDIDGCQANLEVAIAYAGVAAMHLKLDTPSSPAADYQSRAEACLAKVVCREGVQRAQYYLGVCKQLQGLGDLAHAKFEKALQVQLALYDAAHPACVTFRDAAGVTGS